MKIGTVSDAGKGRLVVAVSDATVMFVRDLWPEGPQDMLEAIGLIPELDRRIQRCAPDVPVCAVDSLHWLPPVPRPGKVVCLALNNSANKDRIIRGPAHPAMFTKPASSLLGHGQPIRLRKDYGRVHPEPELAVVIGRGGADIEARNAYDHVFGYTIINDLTSPTMRADDTFHYRAIHPKPDDPSRIEYIDTWVSYPGRYKGADGFGPIGPWIVTRDEIADPHALIVRCLHQGRVVTEDSTLNLSYKIPEVIEFLSHFMTLEAGDIIAMGTALKSAGGGQAVQTVDLNTLGGPIAVSISGIGVLSNPVVHR
jgi:2-keto-4-pentenoate hydratase/2-oxohepta-3-ene-1,7-dioic acid hydratase in catechol pathway